MWKKVQDYMREYEMLRPGDRVIVGVSGGADSVCLLSVLYRIRNALKTGKHDDQSDLTTAESMELRAIHVHHGLRGEEADRDARFVRDLCDKWNIPLVIVHCRVAEYAAQHGLSTEEAGRILRYEAFDQEAKKWKQELQKKEKGNAEKMVHRVLIAVAHHQDDNAETILHHLLRGSGLKGLSGIRPVQGNRIRPLLCVSRDEILQELRTQGLSWCEDSTNQESDYTRNRIRNQMIPMMKEAVNARAVENIVHAGEIFAQADGYLSRQAEAVWRVSGKTKGTDIFSLDEGGRNAPGGANGSDSGGKTDHAGISLAAFCAQEPIVQTYLIRLMLDLVTPGWKDITSRHFRQIADLAHKQVGSKVDLPCGMTAVHEYEELVIKRKSGEKQKNAFSFPVSDSSLPNAGGLTLQIFPRKKGLEIPKNRYTKWFDYDKIKNTLFVRTRQTGDYLTLPGGGTKTVARYMIDEKIPREEREQIPLLADGNHILWVIGGRVSEYYKITDTTKTILQVEFNGGKEDGRECSRVIV
ncbi:MAG: tRNA lysidine(34) synthetase TilS [Brotaphodocola sp.]